METVRRILVVWACFLVIITALLSLWVVCYLAPANWKWFFYLVLLVGPLGNAFLILGSVRMLRDGIRLAGVWFPLAFSCIVYMFLAATFGVSFKAAERLGSTVIDGVPINTPFEYVYFVVVTGSTLGYGDFHPSDWLTQLLAIIEVVEFWLFLGIALALLGKIVNVNSDPTSSPSTARSRGRHAF